MAVLYVESGIWSILWHRVAQMLQVRQADSDLPVHDIEGEHPAEGVEGHFPPPDLNLMSYQGLMATMNIAISIFTKVCTIINKCQC